MLAKPAKPDRQGRLPLMLRVSPKAKENLWRYALQVSYQRNRRVSMNAAAEELMLHAPLKRVRSRRAA